MSHEAEPISNNVMKKEEVSFHYQYLVFRNTLSKIIETNQGIEVLSEAEQEEVLKQAEKRLRPKSGKTSDEFRYEYQYNVMKDTMRAVLKKNKDKDIRLPNGEELQQIHRQSIQELEELSKKELGFAYELTL